VVDSPKKKILCFLPDFLGSALSQRLAFPLPLVPTPLAPHSFHARLTKWERKSRPTGGAAAATSVSLTHPSLRVSLSVCTVVGGVMVCVRERKSCRSKLIFYFAKTGARRDAGQGGLSDAGLMAAADAELEQVRAHLRPASYTTFPPSILSTSRSPSHTRFFFSRTGGPRGGGGGSECRGRAHEQPAAAGAAGPAGGVRAARRPAQLRARVRAARPHAGGHRLLRQRARARPRAMVGLPLFTHVVVIVVRQNTSS
jgi:hypothetical protein